VKQLVQLTVPAIQHVDEAILLHDCQVLAVRGILYAHNVVVVLDQIDLLLSLIVPYDHRVVVRTRRQMRVEGLKVHAHHPVQMIG